MGEACDAQFFPMNSASFRPTQQRRRMELREIIPLPFCPLGYPLRFELDTLGGAQL